MTSVNLVGVCEAGVCNSSSDVSGTQSALRIPSYPDQPTSVLEQHWANLPDNRWVFFGHSLFKKLEKLALQPLRFWMEQEMDFCTISYSVIGDYDIMIAAEPSFNGPSNLRLLL